MGAREGRGGAEVNGRGQVVRCGRDRRVPVAGEPGGAVAARALQPPKGMESHLCCVALEPPPPSHSQYSVSATSEASVFHSVKWGESLPSSLFYISGISDSFQEFL